MVEEVTALAFVSWNIVGNAQFDRNHFGSRLCLAVESTLHPSPVTSMARAKAMTKQRLPKPENSLRGSRGTYANQALQSQAARSLYGSRGPTKSMLKINGSQGSNELTKMSNGSTKSNDQLCGVVSQGSNEIHFTHAHVEVGV